jgi:phenylacetate-coenzyme A ligase PaaK-like adenylate-forming protein
MTTSTVDAHGRTTSTTPQEVAGELLAHDRWTREEVLAHQGGRLESLLRHAVAHSPYYRETLGPEPWARPLSELPILPKSTLMEHWDEVVTDSSVRLAEVEERLAAPDYEGDVAEGVRACTTSGTTGRRGVFVLTQAELVEWLGANMRALARIGVGPGMRICSFGSPSALHMSRQIFSFFRGRPVNEAPPVSVLTPLPELVRHAQEVQPEAMIGYPTVIAALADEQLAGRLDVAPRIIATGSEVLTEDAFDRIRSAWGVEPREAYPATEAPMLASGTPADRNLLIAEDLLVLEVVDEAGRPVAPGVPGHRVLLTNLVNRLQPLIRYELADAVTLAQPSPDWPYTRISRIQGRTSEILELAASGGGAVRVHSHLLRRAFLGMREVSAHQLRIRPDHVTAVVVPASAPDERLASAVERALRAELDELGACATLTVRFADAIDRDVAKAGKLPAIVIEA